MGNNSLEVKLKYQRVSELITLSMLSPILIPVTACVLVVSYLDCGIPPFYLQKRVGYMGKEFNIVKARTMQDLDKLDSSGVLKVIYDDMSPEDKASFDNNFRISRAGRFLRKSRLDELPQIWNILRDEMSIVGPRPHKTEDAINQKYQQRQQ